MSNEDSVNQFNLWNGAVYVTPLLGGYIADTLLGRYHTILAFSVLYFLGLGMFILGEIPEHIQPALVFSGMYIVALGAGGIKPNCSTMGADQFDLKSPQDLKESKQFFSFFYWSINLGALVAYTLVAYICQYGLDFVGGESWGFFVGYLIPTVALGLGIAIFVSGSRLYKKNAPEGSMITVVAGIFYEALVTKRDTVVDADTKILPSTRLSLNEMDRVPSAEGSKHNGQAAIMGESIPMLPNSRWLDRASRRFGGSFGVYQVECVKYVMRILPFLAVQIPYWGIYGQTKTAFQIQGCQMNLNLSSFQIPVSAMNIFNNVTILVLVPLFDQVLYPALRERGIPLKMLTRVWLGFLMAILAMLVAAMIEIARTAQTPAEGGYEDTAARSNISPCRHIDNYNPNLYQEWANGQDVDKPMNCEQICPTIDLDTGLLLLSCISCDFIPQMSRMSVFWQIPQFVIIGISEIFAAITTLEFFYSQAPTSMRSVSQSCNLFTNALGSWLIIPLTLLVNIDRSNMWIASNVNEGHLDYYFFLLAALMFVSLVIFTYLSAGFVYADPTVLEALSNLCASDNEHSAAAGTLGAGVGGDGASSFSPLLEQADGDGEGDDAQPQGRSLSTARRDEEGQV